MSFPTYPEYKDSGVDWLGEVPGHWHVSRLGFESWVRARLGWKGLKAEEYVDDGFAFLSTPNIKGTQIDFENVNFIDQHRFEESPEIKLRQGDVLLAKDGSTLGTVNVVRTLPRPTTVNSSIAVITPHQRSCGEYLYYLFESSYMGQTIQRIKGGMGVPHLFQADLNKFYVPLPPKSEQSQIASFLDRETAKIDALVAEQQRLIELLKEKRQAVISHAVTKGLNPNAPLKPSGIEWLGDVPKHWEVRRVKAVSTFITSGPRGWSEHIGEVGSLFVQSGDLNEFLEVDFAGSQRVSVQDNTESDRTRLCDGDVVVCVTGAKTGNVAVCRAIPEAAYVNQHLCLIRPSRAILPVFLGVMLKSSFGQTSFELYQYGLKQGLSLENIRETLILLPPLSEQTAIVTCLDAQSSEFDALTSEAQRAVKLLQERRTALISAAVTGKIDVRGLAQSEAA